MGTKGWIIFSVIAVGLLGTLIYFSGQNSVDVSDIDANSIIAASEDNGNIGDHVRGNAKSDVVLIEYGDYQCPGCGTINPEIEELVEKYKDKMALVFRHKPLPEMHPNARYAAAVSEAAAKQTGDFWKMHSFLYERQNEWAGVSSSDRGGVFEAYAKTLGLDIEKFNQDIASDEVTKKINFDIAVSRHQNISSTPAFLLNGEVLSQDVWGDKDQLEQKVREALTNAGVELEPLENETSKEEAKKQTDK